MAKVVSQHIVITINKLVKDDADETVKFIDTATIKELEGVVQELVADKSVIVEISE